MVTLKDILRKYRHYSNAHTNISTPLNIQQLDLQFYRHGQKGQMNHCKEGMSNIHYEK